MKPHQHRFVEEYTGLVGFGLDRETDNASLIVYLQKFSDDDLMKTIGPRLTDDELNQVVDLVSAIMKRHLSEDEYHRLFLKDE